MYKYDFCGAWLWIILFTRSAPPFTPCFSLNSAMLIGASSCPKASCTSWNTDSWPSATKRPRSFILVLACTCSGTSAAVTSSSAASAKARPRKSTKPPAACNQPFLRSTEFAMRSAKARTDARSSAPDVIDFGKLSFPTASAYSVVAFTPFLNASARYSSASDRAVAKSGWPVSCARSTMPFIASSAWTSTAATARKYSSHSWRNGFGTKSVSHLRRILS
mmetsp:Transcript_32469/g.95078  ORF Transcript_32469/g.95078 Transcript_32469/m.95078 type:complete len:220 (-) Transcript_32469:103-762(-)